MLNTSWVYKVLQVTYKLCHWRCLVRWMSCHLIEVVNTRSNLSNKAQRPNNKIWMLSNRHKEIHNLAVGISDRKANQALVGLLRERSDYAVTPPPFLYQVSNPFICSNPQIGVWYSIRKKDIAILINLYSLKKNTRTNGKFTTPIMHSLTLYQ